MTNQKVTVELKTIATLERTQKFCLPELHLFPQYNSKHYTNFLRCFRAEVAPRPHESLRPSSKRHQHVHETLTFLLSSAASSCAFSISYVDRSRLCAAPNIGEYIFFGKPLKLFLINSSYNLAVFLAIAVLFRIWY